MSLMGAASCARASHVARGPRLRSTFAQLNLEAMSILKRPMRLSAAPAVARPRPRFASPRCAPLPRAR
jgi:hypothetical protein